MNTKMDHGNLKGLPVDGAFDQYFLIDEIPKKKKNKCKCGGEKTRTTHSDWCPVASEARDG